MRWLDNIYNALYNGHSGNCPYCKSDNTDYCLQTISDKMNFGYMTIWCNDCGKAYHISRILIKNNNTLHKVDIPKGLKFT